jgi:hypothetical protein
MPKTKKMLPTGKPCASTVHHRENIDQPGTALCGAELVRCHYLITGDLQKNPDRIQAIDCPACLRLLFLDAHQGRDWMTHEAVKEGEAKAKAQNEAAHFRNMQEQAQMQRLGLAAVVREQKGTISALREDVDALISRARAAGEVRARHDPVYRLYRDELIHKGTLSTADVSRLLYDSPPGDLHRMREILEEHEHGERCSILARRMARKARLSEVAEPTSVTLTPTPRKP